MSYCDTQQEATRGRCPENTWEALGRMVQSMALDAVALQFSRMDQSTAKRPCDRGDGHRVNDNLEVIR